MSKPHILHLYFHPAFKRAADFANYDITLIIHQKMHDHLEPDFRKQFKEIAILDVPHNMNLNEYDLAMDKIEILADGLVARHGKPTAIVGLFEHVTLPAAKLRERYGLPGTSVEVAQRCRDKVVMKQALLGSTIRVPRFFSITPEVTPKEVDAFLKDLPGAVVYKPRSQAASEGVRIFADASEARAHFQQHDLNSEYELEEFISGSIVHFDGVVRDGKLSFFSAAEYLSSCFDFVTSDLALASVTFDDAKMLNSARGFTEEVLDRLGLRDSVFHLEAFMQTNGQFVFLEIGSRFGGAGVSPLFAKIHKVDLVKEALLADLLAPSDIKTPTSILDTPGSAAWLYTPMPTKKKFVVQGMRGMDQLPPSIFYSEIPNVGDVLNESVMPFPSSGRFFVRSDSMAEVKRDCYAIIEQYRLLYRELV